MPEMLMRYKGAQNRERALAIVRNAQDLAQHIFGMAVVWEAREFGDTNGQPDFSIITQVTDNEDQFVHLAEKVQEQVLQLMAISVSPDERVEHWVQRVKGKWNSRFGQQRPT